jgi:U3 small nucleolar RNA-associated protein 20
VFNEELFGQVAEEKEVKEAISGIFEAKKSKSYDALCILAAFISSNTLQTLINPLKLVIIIYKVNSAAP